MRVPYPVVLASASPRRQVLLQQLVPEFTVAAQHLDEESLCDPDPWVTAQRLAREKALAAFQSWPGHLVIAGDTVVAVETAGGWLQLAKPVDVPDAHRILRELSGREHVVITGLALRWPSGFEAMTETSRVRFRALTDGEIAAYVATGEPMDKAGAYGLQGGARAFVESIVGSTTNVIGLPMERLQEALLRLGRP